MEKQIIAAIPLGAGALVGVELASLLNITSTAGRLIAGLVGAIAGVVAAQHFTK